MIDLDAVRNAGRSTLPTGRLTNPLRRLLWPLVQPWIASLVAAIGPGGAAVIEARQTAAALRKDQMALAHRLASIEMQLAEMQRENAALRARLPG